MYDAWRIIIPSFKSVAINVQKRYGIIFNDFSTSQLPFEIDFKRERICTAHEEYSYQISSLMDLMHKNDIFNISATPFRNGFLLAMHEEYSSQISNMMQLMYNNGRGHRNFTLKLIFMSFPRSEHLRMEISTSNFKSVGLNTQKLQFIFLIPAQLPNEAEDQAVFNRP